MKASKGKEFIPPDKGYTIEEMHHTKSRFKGFFQKVFHKRIRQMFKKHIRKQDNDTADI